MKRNYNIRKITLKESGPPIFRDIRRKPKLLVPFLLSIVIFFIVNVVSALVFSRFIHSGVLEYRADLGSDALDGIIGLPWIFYIWSFILFVTFLVIEIIFSAWSIINYWTYIRVGDFSLSRSFKRTFRYFWKMLGAGILAALILYIPIRLPYYLLNLLLAGPLGSRFYLDWSYEISMGFSIWSLFVNTIFVFIFHAIIIEKENVIGSLKRSYHTAMRNYWLLLFYRITPWLLVLPLMVLGILLYGPVDQGSVVGISIVKGLIPSLIRMAVWPIISLILIRSFILSVKTRGYR